MGLAMGLLTRTRKLYAVLLPTLAHAAAGAVLLPFTCGGWGTGWLPIMLGGYSAVLLGCPVLVVRARFTGRAAA